MLKIGLRNYTLCPTIVYWISHIAIQMHLVFGGGPDSVWLGNLERATSNHVVVVLTEKTVQNCFHQNIKLEHEE